MVEPVKRVKAYIIDLIIVLLVLSAIALIYHPDITAYQAKLNSLSLDYRSGKISFSSYIIKQSNIYKDIDKLSIIQNVINIILITLYFIIVPYLTKGFTIGKKINKIKIKSLDGNLTIKKLLIRNLVINGLLYFIFIVICTFVIPGNYYFSVITIITIIQILLISISTILMFKRKDKRTLHDILSRTYEKNS
ncbi:MAG: RDD family protein [Bacilli bacterium]|nr:RDD family protein [Bacilli bacterium]